MKSAIEKLVFYNRHSHLRAAIHAVRPESGDRVLDAGCGPGAFFDYLSSYHIRAHGLDAGWHNSLKKMAEKRQYAGAREFFVAIGRIEDMPFQDDSFNIVYCLETFEHIQDYGIAFHEIGRVLKSDGILCASIPIEVGPPLLFKQVAARILHYSRSNDPSDSYSLRELLTAGIYMSTKSIPHGTGHKGFHWKLFLKYLKKSFSVEYIEGIPFRHLGPCLSLKLLIVARNLKKPE